jgi:hypothetical protein
MPGSACHYIVRPPPHHASSPPPPHPKPPKDRCMRCPQVFFSSQLPRPPPPPWSTCSARVLARRAPGVVWEKACVLPARRRVPRERVPSEGRTKMMVEVFCWWGKRWRGEQVAAVWACRVPQRAGPAAAMAPASGGNAQGPVPLQGGAYPLSSLSLGVWSAGKGVRRLLLSQRERCRFVLLVERTPGRRLVSGWAHAALGARVAGRTRHSSLPRLIPRVLTALGFGRSGPYAPSPRPPAHVPRARRAVRAMAQQGPWPGSSPGSWRRGTRSGPTTRLGRSRWSRWRWNGPVRGAVQRRACSDRRAAVLVPWTLCGRARWGARSPQPPDPAGRPSRG